MPISKDLLADNTGFMDELAMDSLHVFELILELEKMYGFEVPEERIDNIKTIGDLVTVVDELTA